MPLGSYYLVQKMKRWRIDENEHIHVAREINCSSISLCVCVWGGGRLDHFYRPQRSWGKVMFLHVCVILFTGGGGVHGYWGNMHGCQGHAWLPGGVHGCGGCA